MSRYDNEMNRVMAEFNLSKHPSEYGKQTHYYYKHRIYKLWESMPNIKDMAHYPKILFEDRTVIRAMTKAKIIEGLSYLQLALGMEVNVTGTVKELRERVYELGMM
jgi:hypothetical protein